MAPPTKTPTPPATTPQTTPPLSAGEFAKFDRAIPDSMLAQIITDAPSGPVPPVMTPGVEQIPIAPGQPKMAADTRNLEDESLLAYRAMLRQEEARLEAMPKPPVFAAPMQGVIPNHFGVGAGELVVREGADPLHVESFKILRRMVAGGLLPPGSYDPKVLFSHLEALRKAVEYQPKPAPTTPPVASS